MSEIGASNSEEFSFYPIDTSTNDAKLDCRIINYKISGSDMSLNLSNINLDMVNFTENLIITNTELSRIDEDLFENSFPK